MDSARRRWAAGPLAARRTASLVGGLAAGTWLLWDVATPAAGPSGSEERVTRLPVSVVIPARDEEGSLPALLASLRRQLPAPAEVIVVDDHSSDATAAVARQAGATVLSPPPLPAGWTGKTWGCHHGATHASGEVLCFLDADVVLGEDALAALVDEQRQRGGLVSVQPHHLVERVHERLSAVANVAALMGTGAFSGPPRRAAPMAFGPCLLVAADDYRCIGGHAHPAVRGLVTEDIGLAEQAAAAGLAVTVLAGGDRVGFRMYPDGPGQLVRGWSKMLATGAGRTDPAVAAAVAVWVTGGLVATGGALRSLLRGTRRAPAVAAYVLWAAHMRWAMGKAGRFGAATAVAFPLPLAAFVALWARSLLAQHRSAPVSWHGRPVPVAAGRPRHRGKASPRG